MVHNRLTVHAPTVTSLVGSLASPLAAGALGHCAAMSFTAAPIPHDQSRSAPTVGVLMPIDAVRGSLLFAVGAVWSYAFLRVGI